jgi:Spy/CpxP family protein refolding chaperone
MMKKTIATALTLTLGATLAFAAPQGKGDGEFRKGKHAKHRAAHFEKFAQELNLTDAQKEQIRAQRQNFRESNKARFETHRDTMRQYREARKANDTARAEQLKATLEVQRGELQQLRQAQHQALLQILTPEQRAQLEAKKAEREQRRNERRERRSNQQ